MKLEIQFLFQLSLKQKIWPVFSEEVDVKKGENDWSEWQMNKNMIGESKSIDWAIRMRLSECQVKTSFISRSQDGGWMTYIPSHVIMIFINSDCFILFIKKAFKIFSCWCYRISMYNLTFTTFKKRFLFLSVQYIVMGNDNFIIHFRMVAQSSFLTWNMWKFQSARFA